jgi:hypothetical protein
MFIKKLNTMRRLNYKTFVIPAMMICLITWSSCKKKPFTEKVIAPVILGYDYQDGLLTATPQLVTKENGYVNVPVSINLSDGAPSLFSVSFVANRDTVTKLITAGKLTNTILLPDKSYNFPTNMDVRFGLKTFTITVAVSLSDLELNYGKKMAIGIDIKTVNKGNSIDIKRSTVVVVVNSTDMISSTDVHILKFTSGGERISIGAGLTGSFTEDAPVGSSNIPVVTIPLSATLVGYSSLPVTMQVVNNPDTIASLIASNVLPAGTVAIDPTYLTLPSSITIPANQNSIPFNLKINSGFLAKYYGKTVAIGLKLTNASIYSLDPIDKSQVIVFNTNVLQSITGFLLNTTRTFTTSATDGTRWGIPSGWNVNTAAKNHVKNAIAYGGYDATNTCLALGGVTGDPVITNAKVYQAVTLPAGKYTYYSDNKDVVNPANGTFYFVVATGDGLPDSKDVVATALAYRAATANNQQITCTFTLTAPTKVSIGFVGTSTNGNFLVTVRDIKLWHTYP